MPPQLSEAESQALVQLDVQNAFTGFVSPPGAVPSASDPAPAGELAPPYQSRQEELAYGWWVIPGSLEGAIAWVKAHPPAGAGPASVEDFGPSAPVSSWVAFGWPEVAWVRGREA